MAGNSASSIRVNLPAWFVNLVATVQVSVAMRLASGTLVRIHLTTCRELSAEDTPYLHIEDFDHYDDFIKAHDALRTLLMAGTITASDRFIDDNGFSCSVIHIVPPAPQNCSHPANHSLVFINGWRY